jgi:hypothetical protein
MPRRFPSRLALTVALSSLVALAGACVAGAASGPEVSVPAYHFTTTLPAGWQEVPLTGATLSKLVKAAIKADPGLSADIQNATKDGVKLFAIGPSSGGAVPNINILVEPADGATQQAFLSQAPSEVRSTLGQAGAKVLSVRQVTLPQGKAVEANLVLPLNGGTQQAIETQWYLLHGSDVYIATFTGPTPAANAADLQELDAHWHWTTHA